MAALTRDEIIKGFQNHRTSLEAGETTRMPYDTFIEYLTDLDPRFANVNEIVQESEGAAGVNSLQDQLETAFNTDPNTITAMLGLTDDSSKMDEFINLLNMGEEGQGAVINILAGANGQTVPDLVNGAWAEGGVVTARDHALEAVEGSGMGDIAAAAGTELVSGSLSWGEALTALSVLAAPIALGSGALAGLTGAAATLTSAVAPVAKWLGLRMLFNPVNTAVIGSAIDIAFNDGNATKSVLGSIANTAGEALLGEETYSFLKGHFMNAVSLIPDSVMEYALPAAAIGVAGYLAYNMLSSTIGMATKVAGFALAATGATAAYNYLTRPSEQQATIT